MSIFAPNNYKPKTNMLKTTKILTMMLVLMMGMSFASCDEFLSNNDNPVSPNLKVQTTSLTVEVGGMLMACTDKKQTTPPFLREVS